MKSCILTGLLQNNSLKMCTELYFYFNFLHKNDSYKIRFTFQYLAMDYLPFPSGFPISKSVSFQPFSFFFWQFSLSFG